MINLKQTVERLQQNNEKAYYLAFLRVALCLWFLKELLFRWPVFEILYSNQSFLKISPSPSLRTLHLDGMWLREHYHVLVYICIILLLLNLFGIGRNVVSFLMLFAITLLYALNNQFANAGDEMSMLLALYLSFANTFSHFTLFRQPVRSAKREKLGNLISNLAAYSIMVNLCIAYFMAGLYKLEDPYWRKGTAIYYFLNDERYSLLSSKGTATLPAIVIYLINYGTLAYELAFPFFVWSGRSRNIILIMGLLMHLGIYIFLMIYGMSLIFIMQYGLFYSNKEVASVFERIKRPFRKLI